MGAEKEEEEVDSDRSFSVVGHEGSDTEEINFDAKIKCLENNVSNLKSIMNDGFKKN